MVKWHGFSDDEGMFHDAIFVKHYGKKVSSLVPLLF